MDHWYLIQFKPNSHRLAERNLHRQGFKTFLPMQQFTRRKASRFVSDLKPLFPGYMFVNLSGEVAPCRKINSTVGVSRLVSFEGKPKPLPLQLISGLMHRFCGSAILLPPGNLNEGSSVKMVSGPFAGFIGSVDTIDTEHRIWVLMDIMGRKSRMQVATDQLEVT